MSLGRPLPPSAVDLLGGFRPAPELELWARRTFIEDDGALANPDHAHLQRARIGYLWAGSECRRHGQTLAGMAEIPELRAHKWAQARHDQLLTDWFGEVPDFLITLQADIAGDADDASWCALVEHELYHCGQQERDGVPRFHRDGTPFWAIRGHDVEEFVGVVRRYGPAAGAGRTLALTLVARRPPEVGEAKLALACGTCGAST